MQRLVLPILLAILSPGCASGSAVAAPDTAIEGRWAVRLEGRPVILLDLKRDPAAPGRWSGTSTVAHFRMSEEHAFTRVKGPGAERRIVWADARDEDTLEFKVEKEAGTLIFRLLPGGGASMGWKGVPVKPLILSRVRSDARIPADWDFDRTYKAEDGHR